MMRAALILTILFTATSCTTGPGRSASKAGDGFFDDRNALEPSPCACVEFKQLPPDESFWKRLQDV